jgi:glycine cleavage system aminomethyltransferase T
MSIQDLHKRLGAILADDGIPLHYGNLKAEYQSALNSVVLLDRSHEGRIILRDKDRLDLLNRMSTNKLDDLKPNEGRATLFTNANARILFRVEVFSRPDHLLIVTEPGQGTAFNNYLQKHIFFNDKITNHNIQAETAQFAIHGEQADVMMEQLAR